MPRMSGIDAETINVEVNNAVSLVKEYSISPEALDRATQLYACHLIYVDVLKHKERFKTVKADEGEYTKFDSAGSDDYWEDFQNLLSEQGYRRNHVSFI